MSVSKISVKYFNPYNDLGALHNNALDYFLKNAPADFNINDVFRLSSISALNDLKGKDEYDDLDLIKLQGISGCAFNAMYLPDNKEINFIPINVSGIIKANNFNEVQSSFINELLNPSTDLSLSEYRSVITNIELNILRSSLTCTQKFPLLAATAVGKATALYWQAQIENPKSPWYPVIENKKWWKYVLADVGGALGGAVGGPIGAVGGAGAATIAYALD